MTDGGLVDIEVSGSVSIGFCDYGGLCASRVACFGGRWSNGTNAGTFNLHVNNSTSNTNSNIRSH